MKKQVPEIAVGERVAEVVDQQGRTLAVMRLSDIHIQKLPHRSFVAAVYTNDHKLVLCRIGGGKSRIAPWLDIGFSGHIQASETALLAAQYKIQHKLGSVEELTPIEEYSPLPPLRLAEQLVFVSCRANLNEFSLKPEYLVVDIDEFERLALDFYGQMTPLLQHLTTEKCLFRF